MSSIGTLFLKGMRGSKKKKATDASDQKTINRMTTTRRLKRVKISMPEFKCLKGGEDERG